MIQIDPAYCIEVPLKELYETVDSGIDVMVVCKDEQGVYAAQLLTNSKPSLSRLDTEIISPGYIHEATCYRKQSDTL